MRFALVLFAATAFLGLTTSHAPTLAADLNASSSEITLLFHGSVQGEIIDCGCKGKPLGGLARRAALVEAARDECAPRDCCLLIDCGSLLGRTDDKGRAQTAFLVEETARMNYEAVGVGAWDLRHGLASLRQAQAEGIRFTNANLYESESGQAAFTPFRVREVNGVRVGLISVASAQGLASIELAGLELRSPLEALRQTLPELRAECDLVVLMAQMKSQELRELLLDLQESPLTAVDIAIEGMGSRRYARPNQVGDTWLLAANNRGKVLGCAQLIVSEQGEVLDLDLQIQELRLELPEDPAVAKRVQQFQDASVALAKTP